MRSNESEVGKQLNRHQIQVALIEFYHLIGSWRSWVVFLEDLLPFLRDCLHYAAHGVRHEAPALVSLFCKQHDVVHLTVFSYG